MASLRVLAFDHEGRPIQFDTWLDDLQLYLLSDSRDSVSFFDHTSGASPAPLATADSVYCLYVIRTGDCAGQTCGKPHTQHRCFSRLDYAWCAEFGDEAERSRWAELLRYRGCCSRCCESTLPGTAPTNALHTFTLDSGASCCFFRDSTTLTPLSAPVPVRHADPSGGPVLSRSFTVLPCPAVPSGSLSGLELPSFSTNLPPQVVASAQMSASGPVAPPCSCRLLSHQTLLRHHRLGHPSLPPSWHALPPPCLWSSQVSASPPALVCPALPSMCRGAAACRSSLLVSPDDCSTADSPHGRGEVSDVLIPWIRAVRLQLCERFGQDLPVLRLHSDRGGEFSSDLLRKFMEVARTSMIHAAAPHFLWPFAVRYAAHQLILWPRFSLPETSPTLRWIGEDGDASVFRVWGSRAFVCDMSADKLSARAIPYVFLGFRPGRRG
ncbi:unnamed protein product [Closterium sp. NIES-53]